MHRRHLYLYCVHYLIIMKFKIPTLLTAIAALCLLSACGSKQPQFAHKGTNILGIYKSEPAAYSATKSNTIPLSTTEIMGRDNITGNKVTLLWGLITLKDY
ncbi:MAG: hypothetical protein ACPGF8_02030 [Opitutales bacterium]